MDPQPPTREPPVWARPQQAAHVPAVADGQPRIGAAERDLAEQRLRAALRDDVLTITEYDERLTLVMAARTQPELDEILADLPVPHRPAPPAQISECARVVAVLGNTEQRGRWRPAKGLQAIAVLGGARVDLRDAVTSDGTYEVNAYAVLGTVDVVVPDDAAVEMDGFSVLGDRSNGTLDPQASGVAVRINGYAVMGEINVRTATKREKRRWRADGDVDPPAAAPEPQRRKGSSGWGARIAAIALLGLLGAGPIRAAATADATVLFGSRQYLPTSAQIAGDNDIEVASFFGSIEVVLPEGVYARYGGMQIFGSAECHAPCEGPVQVPRVEIEATSMFGSVQIRHAGEPGR
jgi:hypothetical protein